MPVYLVGALSQPILPDLDKDAMVAVVTRYPEGTVLESLCPECLSRGGVLDKKWCHACIVERSEWIRVVWRRKR